MTARLALAFTAASGQEQFGQAVRLTDELAAVVATTVYGDICHGSLDGVTGRSVCIPEVTIGDGKVERGGRDVDCCVRT